MREYMITMESVRDPEIIDVVIIEAETIVDACISAFVGRNIASSWRIIDGICDEHPCDTSGEFFPIAGEWYTRTGRVT